MEILTEELQSSLAEMVKESYGNTIQQDKFAEVILDLFEDIAGLEATDAETQALLIQSLWKKYHD